MLARKGERRVSRSTGRKPICLIYGLPLARPDGGKIRSGEGGWVGDANSPTTEGETFTCSGKIESIKHA